LIRSDHNITTYRYSELPKYPFCPGCGHGVVLDSLNEALVSLQLDPHKVVIVTDIGCVGMSDQYFATHSFHGLHGRSVAYATGIKLACPELTVIVLIGDGGCGIGGHHLINAARRNVGISVLVFDNFNFGMTGGQHSVTTPQGALTASTWGGNLERPLDICATVGVNGAGYVYRATQFDPDLAARIAEALTFKGFALLDIWDLCTAHYASSNRFSRIEMNKLLSSSHIPTGLIQRRDYPEFTSAYADAFAGQKGKAVAPRKGIDKKYDSTLLAQQRIVLAGSAGGKVKSAATILARAAMLSGLWCTQRDDYPTTVMSGHSVSEVILSRSEIVYTGISQPDILALLTAEGLAQVREQLAAMDEKGQVYFVPELADLVESRALKIVLSGDLSRIRKSTLAITALAAIIRNTNMLPLDALEEAIHMAQRPEIVKDNLQAVQMGTELI
jgi:2-oxoglutarate/2-oxoacid ferredoxin oxidoreductase subunit beta